MSAKLSRIRLLLIDDHLFMRSIWRSLLSGLGVSDIVAVSDAREAFALLESETYDLIITDYHLGDLNGAEFISRLRTSADLKNPLIPIIACTADTRRQVISELINAGVDEVMAKPVSATIVWTKLHAVAERRRSFIKTVDFLGPDRRRRRDPKFSGRDRRDTVDI